MNKFFLGAVGVILLVIVGIWYISGSQTEDVVVKVPPVTKPVTVAPSPQMYTDKALGYSLTFPTALTTVKNAALYRVETGYTYTGLGGANGISGVKFTIPEAQTTETNLSADSYLSIEHITQPETCDAAAFLNVPDAAIQTRTEGTRRYSFASTTETAAGNRYEEYVYVVTDSKPCIAVRYFIHSTALANYDANTRTEFDRTKLYATFDAIRSTLTLKQ